MSQSPPDPTPPATPVPPYVPATFPEPSPNAATATRPSWAGWLWLPGLLAAAALLSTGLLWQKVNNMQEELARRSLDSGAQAIEARTLARQAEEGTRELAARLALLDGRISEVSLQRSQLEDLMQSLSRSRDENMVVDVESALRLAQQQAQLTGSAEPLLAALRSAEQRLQRAAQPRLNPLQRAIAKDTERIKEASLTDVPALLLKLDELSRMADDLPLANGLLAGDTPRLAGTPATRAAANRPVPGASAAHEATSAITGQTLLDKLKPGVWFQGALDGLQDEARKLLRVSRIDNPEAALMSPVQSFFLRENFKLRLLNARLSLLSRQTEIARSDLVSANGWLGKYFDPASRRTQAAVQLLQQVQSQIKSSELPRLDDTMTALATAAAGR